MTGPKTAISLAPRRAARALVRLYRATLSPIIGFHCRHVPTCSQYCDEALRRFGLWAGGGVASAGALLPALALWTGARREPCARVATPLPVTAIDRRSAAWRVAPRPRLIH